MRALAALLLVAACGNSPPFTLEFKVTSGDVQACTTSAGTKAVSCSDVTMLCDAYVSIRIFAPSDPTAPFIYDCQQLVGKKDLCSIAAVNLTAPAMPVNEQTLEVDMAVYPKQSLHTGSDGNLECPHELAFGADGFPAPQEPCTDPDPANCEPAPAIGGRAFYHPGDSHTVVSLGCTDLAKLEDPVCAGMSKLAVTASVNDFDTGVSVSSATADNLLVSIGEPTPDATAMGYSLKSTDTRALTLMQNTVPSWSANVDLQLQSSACIEVFEDGAQTTAALTCTNQISATALDLPGVRLAKPTLDGILTALNKTFPLQGMVVGLALDYLGNPLPGVTITPIVPMLAPPAHIQYMAADGMSFPAGQTSTSSKGIWVSTDAAYGTSFIPQGMTMANDGFGGLVAGKVDIVIIQLAPPNTGG